MKRSLYIGFIGMFLFFNLSFGQDCIDGVEVELWGECYNIEETTTLEHLSSSTSGQEIPPEIGELINLTHLYLDWIGLIGEIPSSIGNLTNLTGLYLYSNQLTGEIPQAVCDLIESNNLDIDNILDGNELTNTCE